MKALSINKQSSKKQLKLTGLLVAIVLILVGAIFILQNRINLVKKALGPECSAPGICRVYLRPEWEQVEKYIIKVYEDGTLLSWEEKQVSQLNQQELDQGYIDIRFTVHRDSTYKCEAVAQNICGSDTGQNQDICTGISQPTPTTPPTPTQPPPTSPTPTDIQPSVTPMPSTTPVPGCYDRICSNDEDCTGLKDHSCIDVGDEVGKRCVLNRDANCDPDDKTCWCTIQPTNIPTSTPLLSPSLTPTTTTTPVPGQPTNTPIPGEPTNTPTPTGDVGGDDDQEPTPTDIIIVKSTNTPTPDQYQPNQQPTLTPTGTEQIPEVGFFNPTLIILILGFAAILIPLFI